MEALASASGLSSPLTGKAYELHQYTDDYVAGNCSKKDAMNHESG